MVFLSQNEGYLFGGPYNKDQNILGSTLGSPYFGKLPQKGGCFVGKVSCKEFCHVRGNTASPG